MWHNYIEPMIKSVLDDMVKFPFYVRLALTLLAIVLVVFILNVGKNIFIPLLFGLLASILLLPVNYVLERRLKLGRVASPMISVILFVSALGFFVYFLALQISYFSRDMPTLRKRFSEMFANTQHWLSTKLQIDGNMQTDYVHSSVSGFLQNAAQSASNILLSTIGVVVLLVFVFIFTFFMLYHRKLLMRFVLHLFNVQHRDKVQEVIIETKSMINSYVVGLVIEMAVLSVANSVLLLVMGIRYPVLLGVVAAVLNIIPYLGIYTSIALTMLVTFANNTPSHALQAGIGLFVVHVLDANILMPRVVGSRVKMNPFITILAVILGEAVWGIPGMFLFIPLTGILKLICDRVDGLEAWGMLMGVEEEKPKKKVMLESGAAEADLKN